VAALLLVFWYKGKNRMGLKESGWTGRNVTESIDGVTGLLLQNPESIVQSPAGLDDTDLPSEQEIEIEQTQYGQPFVMAYTVLAHADAGGDTLTVALMDPAGTADTPNGPAPFMFRVLRWWTRTGDVAGTPEGVMTINHLSSASAANAMTNSFDIALNADDIGFDASGTGQLIDPYDVVDAGEGIQLSIVLGANEEADFTIFFECMRVVA
jgi:hypothetical protein